MKTIAAVPFALVATILVPQMKQEDPIDTLFRFKREILEKSAKIDQLNSLKNRNKTGETISLAFLGKPSPAAPDPAEIQKIRQEVVMLQEKYDTLRFEDEEKPVEIKEPPKEEELNQPHPLIKPNNRKLAFTYFRLGRYEKAWDAFRIEEDLTSQLMTALCLERLGQVKKSARFYLTLKEKYSEGEVAKRLEDIINYLEVRMNLEQSTKLQNFVNRISSDEAPKEDAGQSSEEDK